MFTGLIEAIGSLKSLGKDSWQINYPETSSIGNGLAIGDSVAVDGICLTVEKILAQGFVATVSSETLQRTTLTQVHLSSRSVNLETSLRVGSKLGGHFVTGHIDGVGCLHSSVVTSNSWEMKFAAPIALEEEWGEAIAPYIVPKGSIAVNGVSLTVAACGVEGEWFQVAVIPHSFSQTNLAHLKIGDWVNIEGDILGKYVEKLIQHPRSFGSQNSSRSQNQDITPAFLEEHGYL